MTTGTEPKARKKAARPSKAPVSARKGRARTPASKSAKPHAVQAASTKSRPVRRRRREGLPATAVVLVNPLSGSVDAKSAGDVAAILKAHRVDAQVVEIEKGATVEAVTSAVKAGPELVITLAGDGTANLAASLCGAKGPMVAPLAGGTMNMLPFSLYGKRPWREALEDTLERGEETAVSGGEVGGRPFYVAALIGEPTKLAYAREAAREGHLIIALRRVRDVVRHAFDQRIRFALEGHAPVKTETLALLCPSISRAMHDDKALEAIIIDPSTAREALRLGFRTLLADVLGDWRNDPAVTAFCMRSGRAWSRRRLSATLDGEPVVLPRSVSIRFVPVAFRAYAAKPLPEPPEAPDIKDMAG